MSNSTVKSILKKRGFFDNILEILKLIKNVILILERMNTILADCYL